MFAKAVKNTRLCQTRTKVGGRLYTKCVLPADVADITKLMRYASHDAKINGKYELNI